MSYIGRSSKLVRKAQDKVSFLATAGQTVKTGLSYTPTSVEVTVNGILLTDVTDYTASNGNSVTFLVALALNDEVTVVSHKTFTVADTYSKADANTLLAAKLPLAGGTMTGDTLHGDNVKAKFGTGNDLEIYHDGNKSYISDVGTGNLILTASNLTVKDAGGTNKYLTTDASTTATTIYHNNVARLATTSTGVSVTGSTAHTAGDITNSISGSYKLFGANGTAGNANYVTYAFEGDNNTGMFSGTADTVKFATGGSERMRISSTGALLVKGDGTHGYVDPDESLSVSTSRSGTHDYGIFVTGNDAGGGTHFQMRFYNNVHGVKGSITTTSGGTAFNTSSDYRLKTDIQDVSTPIDKVKLLKPCNFAWVAEPDVRIDGFIAHEVAEVVPEAVSGTKDEMVDKKYEVTPAVVDDEGNEITAAVMGTRSVPQMQGVDQSKLVPLLTATIQELIARIEALENN